MAIVSIAVPILILIDRIMRRETRSRRVVMIMSSVIGALGLYWLIDRTLLS